MGKEEYYNISGMYFDSFDYSSSEKSIIVIKVSEGGRLEIITDRLVGGVFVKEISQKEAEKIKKSYGNPTRKNCFLLTKEE